MIHHRQGLPLRLEAGDDLFGVHAQLDDLQRDTSPHRLGLLGDINHATAAFAELLQQLVTANHVPGFSDMTGEEGKSVPYRKSPRSREIAGEK